jgi:hypothetical protein
MAADDDPGGVSKSFSVMSVDRSSIGSFNTSRADMSVENAAGRTSGIDYAQLFANTPPPFFSPDAGKNKQVKEELDQFEDELEQLDIFEDELELERRQKREAELGDFDTLFGESPIAKEKPRTKAQQRKFDEHWHASLAMTDRGRAGDLEYVEKKQEKQRAKQNKDYIQHVESLPQRRPTKAQTKTTEGKGYMMQHGLPKPPPPAMPQAAPAPGNPAPPPGVAGRPRRNAPRRRDPEEGYEEGYDLLERWPGFI